MQPYSVVRPNLVIDSQPIRSVKPRHTAVRRQILHYVDVNHLVPSRYVQRPEILEIYKTADRENATKDNPSPGSWMFCRKCVGIRFQQILDPDASRLKSPDGSSN